MTRYVALGSSMAAGPGIAPRAPGSPRAAMRSARNYPHLLAADLGLEPGPEFVDVSFSGATTAHLLTDSQLGAPPQVEALDGTETLVTITIGGNDVFYVPGLLVATIPSPLRLLPVVGPRLRHALDPTARQVALAGLGGAMRAVARAVRRRSPQARVVFVDYLTLLPPAGQAAFPLRERYVDQGRRTGERLAAATAAAAAATGCELVAAGAASREHHAWSADPWSVGARVPLPGRPLAYHPNATGMRAVADLVKAHLEAG
ncbi:SGNH/GDSL hydrolase family protein [Nocardioides plantarum]|uniref:SGNH/GDSL hydrolase family protein n=1 Tax=Nocardioides plantarum TaxID=29299 RepID=A0ABV5KA56_9ACTN|nr:SGNH/GDSL hydrolase family protein [Nocardioides plantarum]